MFKFILLILSFVSIFPISIENEDHLKKHQDLSYWKDFNAVGFVCTKSGNNNYGLGSGCFIHPYVVLTAAHVVAKATEVTFYAMVKSGDSYIHKEFKGRAISHPKYVHSDTKYIKKGSEPYDIALIILDKGNFEAKIPSLVWNYSGVNETYYIVGYGKWKNDTPADYLSNRRLAAISNRVFYDIDKKYMWVDFSNKHEFKYFGSSRQGDSGGPILTISDNQPVIYGVTQSAVTLRDEKEPSYGKYTSVSFNLDWILNTINKEL